MCVILGSHRTSASVHSIVKRGGRVLLPVFVLGRAQELLLLLDEYWSQHPELHSIPIYYASSLARKCISIYQTYIHTMNEHVRSRFNRRDNPFVFKHVSNLRSLDKFDDRGPCVMMASPGFMQSGLSRELLERWAPDRRNGLIVTGYSVEGTMARSILKEPDEIMSIAGQRIPLLMSVEYISFSAHVDFTQNSKFIDEIKAQHIVLVHGEQNNMHRLKAALQGRYSDRAEDIKIHTPRNCEPLHIKFRGERMARAIGSIATKPPKQDDSLSGLLISKDFAYTILDPGDLLDFTGLSTSTIIQRQRIALHVNWSLVLYHLSGMFGQLLEGVDLDGKRTVRIMQVLDLKQSMESKYEYLLEWKSGVANDMVADSCLALLLGIEGMPSSVKATMSEAHQHEHGEHHVHPHADAALDTLSRTEKIAAFLEAHFGATEEIVVGGGTLPVPHKELSDDVVKSEDPSEAPYEPQIKEEDPDVEMDKSSEHDAVNGTAHSHVSFLDQFANTPERMALYVKADQDEAIIDSTSLAITASTSALHARIENLIHLANSTTASLATSYTLEPQLTSELFQGQHTHPLEPGSDEAKRLIAEENGKMSIDEDTKALVEAQST